MHGSFLGISAIHCSKMLGHPAFGPHGDPVVFSGPTHPKEIQKLWNQEMLTSLGALLLCFSDGANVQRLDDCSMCMFPKRPARKLAGFFLGGWAGVICIWSRLLRNGACLLLITAFYEPRSREKPDSTLAFQSFLGLKKQCILHDFIHFQGANWKHIKWFFANGICTLTQALLTSSSTAHMHEQMNSFKRHPGNGNTICLFETPYVFLCFYWWFAETRIVHSLSINDLKSSNWKRF